MEYVARISKRDQIYLFLFCFLDGKSPSLKEAQQGRDLKVVQEDKADIAPV